MSVSPHVIRLNGPWQAYLAVGTAAARVQLPRDWGTILPQVCDASLKLSRAFHAPTGLHGGDEVVLVLDDLPILGKVSLNGNPLGSFRRSERFSITEQLTLRNEIEISGEPLNADERIGEVRLEIFAQ